MSAREQAKARLMLASFALGQAQRQLEEAEKKFRQALNGVEFTKDEERRTSQHSSTHQRATFCGLCDLEQQLHEDAQGFHHVIKGERVACPVSPAVLDTPTGGAE